MSDHEDDRIYKRLITNLLHPPVGDRRFWNINIMVGVASMIHFGADMLQDHGGISVPGFVSILLLFIPLVYAGTTFGLVGSLAVTSEGILVCTPTELFFPHTASELWGAWSILATVSFSAVLLGIRFEQDKALHKAQLTTERMQTADYYQGHPLFGEHLLAKLPDGVTLVDNQGVIRYANEPLEILTGYSPAELVGKPVEMLIAASQRGRHVRERLKFTNSSRTHAMGPGPKYTIMRKAGGELSVNVSLAPYTYHDSRWFIAMIHDDAQRRAAEEARIEAEKRFQLAFDNNVAGMLITDLRRKGLAVNQSFCKMIGRDATEILGKDTEAFTFPDDRGVADRLSARMLAGGKPQQIYTKRYVHKDEYLVWTEVSKSLARDESGVPQYFINSVRDITEERTLFDQLSFQALHDPLTGLANRAMFQDKISLALEKTTRENRWMAIFLIDLDDFKDVNDTYGHQTGDELLIAVARRLEKVSRLGGTLCRFGGDEFLYLAEGLSSPKEAEGIATRLLGVFDQPFVLSDQCLTQTASVGVATCLGGESCDNLLRGADNALYEVKRQHGGHYKVFQPKKHRHNSTRIRLVQDLQHAFDANQLQLHYQPIVELSTGETMGVEALMRWSHPIHGWVSPDVFIPLAERSRLIFDLGTLAIRQSIGETVSWLHPDPTHQQPYVAVNLSPRQFLDPNLFRKIKEVLDANEFDPNRLVLEITEGAAFLDIEKASRVAKGLRNLGIVLAIDDFGTGHSSLSYFTLLHPRILKIDRSFINRMQSNTSDQRLLAALIAIGDSLNASVVAEGIETTDQLDMLRSLGYKFGQGYLFSAAVPATDLRKIIEKVPTSLSTSSVSHTNARFCLD